MAITTDWQVELRSVTLGSLAAYELVDIRGLAAAPYRARDMVQIGRHGAVGATDELEPRSIDVDLEVCGTSAATCMDALHDLVEAWRPSTSDLAFDVRVPGSPETTVRFYGRPRRCEHGSLRVVPLGYMVSASVTFEALDPLRYGAAVSSTTNSGNATSDRCTITLTGTGGTPSLTNTSDGSGAIVWNTTLALSATRIIDLRAKTVVDGSGVDKRSEVLSTSSWFRFVSGANSITVSGVSAAYSLRPAWF